MNLGYNAGFADELYMLCLLSRVFVNESIQDINMTVRLTLVQRTPFGWSDRFKTSKEPTHVFSLFILDMNCKLFGCRKSLSAKSDTLS